MADETPSADETTSADETPSADETTSADGNPRTDKPELTYEQARDELVTVVTKLEAGGTTLEESLALWQRGEDLADLCERYLEGARKRLDAASSAGQTPAG